MSNHVLRSLALSLLTILAATAQDFSPRIIQAPPPPPPPLQPSPKQPKIAPAKAADGDQYLIGDPTDEEQLFLELVNRARKDPNAEARRLLTLDDPGVLSALHQYAVDTNLMVAQFTIYSNLPPLSFNPKLIQAARDHSQYMLDRAVQSHEEIFDLGDGLIVTNKLDARYRNVGYLFATGAENIYSYTENIPQGHAGFEIDWGSGPNTVGGMQNPPGHRDNTHDIHGRSTEIGVGIIHGRNQVGNEFPVGPILVTQDYARPLAAQTFITGVAFYDLNGNDFYDLGEGLGGITVTIDGQSAFAITTGSGGYSIPVPPGQNYTVRFKPPGGAEVVATAAIEGADNFKLDFKPAFVPETILSKPASIVVGADNPIQISTLPGATGYRARFFSTKTPAVEGAETLTNVNLLLTGDYPGTSVTGPIVGSRSFRLTHISDNSSGQSVTSPQIVQFKTPYSIRPGAEIRYRSRLGNAYLGEYAKVQVSVDEGVNWTTIFSQRGITNFAGVETFPLSRTNSLASFAGKVALVRFNFDVDLPFGWFPFDPANKDDGNYGWFFDDINFVNMDQIVSTTTADVDTNAIYHFAPPTVGNYLLQFQALNGARPFPWGQVQSIAVTGQNSTALGVNIVGNGTVTPNLDGQTLVVGNSYTLTANPAPGYTFVGWTGSIESSARALTFTMQLNTSLTATFADAAPPTVAFAAPTANLTVTNANFTVQGTAADNEAVASVLVRLQTSTGTTDFMLANGTNSWSLPVTLAPGPNVLLVRAIDIHGNISADVSSKAIQYDVPSPFHISIVGKGMVTPNLSASNLVVGKSYTINATPALGFSFGGWVTNGVTNFARMLKFTMRPNLAITANFIDTTIPTLTVVAPKLNERTTNQVVIWAGTAKDNDSVSKIDFQINNREWVQIAGTNKWAVLAPLQPGPNILRAYAEDPSGRHSRTNIQTVTYVVTAPFNVNLIGKGTFSPNLSGQRLEVGKSYTINAAPALGFSFAGWVIDGVTNAAKALKFTMPGGLSVTAVFRDTAIPTLTVTAPKLNERTTNRIVLVKGTAKDNDSIAAIHYQLNNNPWADLAGAANWQTSVELAPGPNLLRAYAEDATGNRSKTNVQTVIYVVTAPFDMNIVGKGTVAPNLNGQRLEVGKSYTITALAAVGSTFTGWVIDGVTNTAKALKFTMPDSLSVTAVFRDTAIPTLTVTAPKLNERTTNHVVLVKGTAKDNDSIAAIHYQLNNNPWADLVGAANWQTSVELAPGPNLLRAYAEDATGNRSKTNVQTVIYVVTAPFDLNIVGKGTVAPNLNGQRLEVGKSYTVTATSAAGFAFSGWITNGVTNLASRLTFVMSTNGLSAEVDFKDNTGPKLAITSPKLNERVTNEVVVIRGTASDNVGVAGVKLRIDGSDWFDATGAANWTADPGPLARGLHKVDAFAFDLVGKHSPTNSVTFTIPTYDGIYFGAFTAPNMKGVVGLMVRANQEALLLGGDTGANAAGITIDEAMPVSAAGVFDFGKFTATGASGIYITAANQAGAFTALKAPATGARVNDVGLYEGTFTITNGVAGGGPAYALIAADGSILLATSNIVTTASAANKGTVTALGATGLAVNKLIFKGSINTPLHQITGNVLSNKTVIGLFALNRTLAISGLGISAGDEPAETLAAVKQPAPPASTLDAWIQDGSFTLWFSTEPGRAYTIQQSTDLNTWTDLDTFTAQAPAYEHQSPASTAHTFYRILTR